ncbi:DUF2510 domain-containing protein [Arthrobacter antibioticus]|uniref:DUF2510 domain-containing protein n=1 Tax=Arthrobacter sp. H35-MC1 TaxID=3046203 RepID=UPI0024BB3550|nr:DUF2510 domain-containing protein [Arthrobacter sp. H35-MC1]MDJ0317455.1 DUF2510 domain-containing protein [Arthrobacter sp. H35-MC1]
MGKMKGNRLNTAVNTGSFVTGRQQLKVQRQIAYNTGIQAQLAHAQLQQMQVQQQLQLQAVLDAEFARLCEWADQEVAAGRRTQENAKAYVETLWLNKIIPPPTKDRLLVGTAVALLRRAVSSADTAAGWYVEMSGMTARYWDGQSWTMQVQSRTAAQLQVKAEALELKKRIAAEKSIQSDSKRAIRTDSLEEQLVQSRSAAAPGWYPMSGERILRYFDGSVWTDHTRPLEAPDS